MAAVYVVLELSLVAMLHCAIAVWFTWPLAPVAASEVGAHGALLADTHVYLWILEWVRHALTSNPLALFDGNVLHPLPRVVAASETMLGLQPIFGPVSAYTGNPVLGLNVLVLASFVLCGTSMYVLVQRWTGSRVGAFVAGLAFAFAPWRLDVGRVHLLQVYYYPLVALLIDRTAESGRARDGVLAAGALVMQVLCSYYLGYQAYAIAAMVVIGHVAVRGWRATVGSGAGLAIALLGPLVVIVPISVPYLLAQSGGDLPIPWHAPDVAAEWAYLGKSLGVVRLYVGMGTLVVGAAGVLGLGAARRDPMRATRTLALLLIAILGLAIAPGPAGFLDGWVSPYRWLAVFVPGFARMRAPVRFAIISGFALSALAGMVVADLLRRRSTGARVGALLAVVVIAVPMTQVRAVDGTPIPTGAAIPSVYHWLAEHGDGGTLVELPIGPHLGLRMNLEAARAMYFSTRHWLPLVNGYTSYKPPAYALFEAYAAQLPSAEALQALVDCAGLRWVLVHARHHARRFDDVPGLRRVGAFSTEGGLPDVLYAVTLTSPGHLCAGGLPAPGRTLAGNPTSRERELEGVVEVRGVPPTVRPRTPFQASIVLTNRGDRLWAGTALDEETRVRIEVRWLDESDQAVDATQSIALPGDAAPGRSVAFEAWIDAPSRLGRHRLQVLLRRGEGTGPAALTWQTPVFVGG